MQTMKMLAATAVLAACMACGGNGEEVPALEQQSVTAPQETQLPRVVRGCLGAGGTDGTYVLAAGADDTGADAATYQLEGELGSLAEHIGRRVEVSGTVVSSQVARSRGAVMPAEDEPTGTSGTPTVQSTTEVEVRRLQVDSVTPVDADCGDENRDQ
jgi:hypothetical protein